MANRTGAAVGFCVLALLAGTMRLSAQDMSKVIALHSFGDVPTLPKDVTELFKRYGDVTTPDGSTEKGDQEGEVHATKAAGGSLPAMANIQVQTIRQNELNDLVTALGSENDLFVYVYGNAVPPEDSSSGS